MYVIIDVHVCVILLGCLFSSHVIACMQYRSAALCLCVACMLCSCAALCVACMPACCAALCVACMLCSCAALCVACMLCSVVCSLHAVCSVCV